MEKIIFDLGANEGQNIKYFLNRSDYVVCVEANPILCEKINTNFKDFIDSGRLFVENCAISNLNVDMESFFVHKKKHTHSQLTEPQDLNEFSKIEVKVVRASNLINKYLNNLNLDKAHYIKIDIEHLDHIVFKEILDSDIKFNYISCEVHSSLVLKEVILSNLKFFKVVIGKDVKKLNYINNENIKINFMHDSSGPFGDDIKEKWINKTSLITFFVNHGFGWFDICCSNLNENNIEKELIYDLKIHKPIQLGFRYHFKRLIPEFIRSSKNIIRKIVKK